MARLKNSTNLKYRDDLGGLCQICNDYGFENMILDQLDKLKRQLKRDFEKELAVNPDGQVIHDPCISHCLPYAFGEYNNKHKIQYLKSELNLSGAVIIADYKMRILPQSAHETKQDFFGKRGWTLHTILIFMRETNSNKLDIEAYDHCKKPKWIKVISDNDPHYHNSELMAIVSYWHTWYDIEVWTKLWNTPLHQPQPSISQYTTSETQWTMSIALESDLIENDKNADEILPNEQPNDPNSFNSKEEIDIDQKFPLAKGWALKGNQKLGRRGGKRMKKRGKSPIRAFFPEWEL
uniref:Uncharacterized protein n=1 Tax=Rhizophagus irregularis (strain DAOM 181602 / DAOM 197198 / MUCL 43194) TaxID=747089 RepID=U9UEF6_RHIID